MVNIVAMFCPVTYAITLCSFTDAMVCMHTKTKVKSKGQVVK